LQKALRSFTNLHVYNIIVTVCRDNSIPVYISLISMHWCTCTYSSSEMYIVLESVTADLIYVSFHFNR